MYESKILLLPTLGFCGGILESTINLSHWSVADFGKLLKVTVLCEPQISEPYSQSRVNAAPPQG